MRTILIHLFIVALVLTATNTFAQVGIGTNSPAASAALEVTSSTNNKGILIPRITASQKDVISNPAEGLLIYQTSAPIGFYYYTGTAWKLIMTQADLDAKLSTVDATLSLNTKVDKVTGKELSSNDFTSAEKTKLAAISGSNTGDQDLSTLATAASVALKANISDVNTNLAAKVDKVTGKELSTNDFSTAEKLKLAAITGNVAGPTGPQGPIGLTGPAGATGLTGAIGAVGPTGLTGPAGNDGAVGPTGAPGPTGLTGPAGNDGAVGPQGATGAQGPIGLTGATGLLSSGTTAGNTPYWDGTQWVVNSNNLFNNGSNLGIGTATPAEKLDVVGNVKTSGTLTAGTVTYPNTHGSANQVLSTTGSGTLAWTTPSTPSGANSGDMQYWNGTTWVVLAVTANEGASLQMIGGVPTWTGGTPPSVTSPTTGRVWMDRNLGATRVAISSTDAASYGDYYQWGRGADGHQIKTSPTTSTLSSTDSPGNGNFINNEGDWRSSPNVNLWQGVNGVNNPCPSGYRIPTISEWGQERAAWRSTDNAEGAFASALKLPSAGLRIDTIDMFFMVGEIGLYWSSTVNEATTSRKLYISAQFTDTGMSDRRATGLSVRCIKH